MNSFSAAKDWTVLAINNVDKTVYPTVERLTSCRYSRACVGFALKTLLGLVVRQQETGYINLAIVDIDEQFPLW